MRPRADEILRSVVATFDDYVTPDVTDPFAKSLALTMSNLLRHVALRIEGEGQILFDDNADLRSLLAEVRALLAARPDSRFEVEVKEIEQSLAVERYGPGVYPSLALLTEEATELRWALQHSIRALDAAATDVADIEGYDELRVAIRRYLRRSLEREMALIVPAFTGERR